jgi:hypothetical protein
MWLLGLVFLTLESREAYRPLVEYKIREVVVDVII